MTKEEQKEQKKEKKAKLLPGWARFLMILAGLGIVVLVFVLAFQMMSVADMSKLNSPDFTTADLSSAKGLFVLLCVLAVVEVLLVVAHFVLPKLRKKKVAVGSAVLAIIIALFSLAGPVMGLDLFGGDGYQTVINSEFSLTSTTTTLKNVCTEGSNSDIDKLATFIETYATKVDAKEGYEYNIKAVKYSVKSLTNSLASDVAYAMAFDQHPHEAYGTSGTTIWDFYVPNADFDSLAQATAMEAYTEPTDKTFSQEYFMTYGGGKRYSGSDEVGAYSEITPSFTKQCTLLAQLSSGTYYTKAIFLIDPANSALRLIIYPTQR